MLLICLIEDFFAQRSYTDQNIDFFFHDIGSDFPVQPFFICSKFQHVSQDRHLSSDSSSQKVNSRPHGHRICVIAVIDHSIILQADNVAASADSLYLFDPLLDLFYGKAEQSSYCCCRQGVSYHMLPRQRHFYREYL